MLRELINTGSEQQAIESTLRWDYSQLGDAAPDVMAHAVEIKRSERRASEAIVEAGRHLIAVKESLEHGQWEDWLETEFKMSDRTARRMMAVAKQFDGKTDTVSVLGPSVLYLLAGDSVPEPAREAVIDLAKGGESVTKVQAQTIIEEHKPQVQRLFVDDLKGMVAKWMGMHWQTAWPDNPAHTNGEFWRELTAWMHANVTATWTESDLKEAVKQLYAASLRRSNARPPTAQIATTGAAEKFPITDWELSDICETVAGEFYGADALALQATFADMNIVATTCSGGYWKKLQPVLQYYNLTDARIAAGIRAASSRMMTERGLAKVTPAEAKTIGREVKAATWGDKPYAEVWEIQTALGAWQHGLTATELRALARYRGGAAWFDCRVKLGEIRYRDRDLVQALNNLASQIEQSVNAPKITTQIAPARIPGEGESTESDWASIWCPISGTIDEANARRRAFIDAITPWALAWTDDQKRTWRDLVDRNPQHANSPFRQALDAECRRRGVAGFEGALPLVIIDLFAVLLTTHGSTSSDNYLLSNDVQTEPDAAPAQHQDDRIGRAQQMIGIYQAAIATETMYGDLTGCHTEWLEPRRGLQKLIDRLQRLVDLLTGQIIDNNETDGD